MKSCWIVVSAGADFIGGDAPYKVFESESAARVHAAQEAERSSMSYNWDIYEVTWLGQMRRGRALFHSASQDNQTPARGSES